MIEIRRVRRIASFLIVAWIFLEPTSCTPVSQSLSSRFRRSKLDRFLPEEFIPNFYGSDASALRTKREVIQKQLTDSKSCIYNCWTDDVERGDKAEATLAKKFSSKEIGSEDPAVQQKVVSKAFDSVGPLMHTLCTGAKSTKQCLNKCPDSQLKDLAVLDYYQDEVACEPEKNFGGYPEYKKAIDCSNNTFALSREYCAQQCKGTPSGSIREVTSLYLDMSDEDESTNVIYESNTKRNTDNVGLQCMYLACRRDCNVQYLTKKCGKKATDLYIRTTAVEPRSAVKMLLKLKAISSIPTQCKSFTT